MDGFSPHSLECAPVVLLNSLLHLFPNGSKVPLSMSITLNSIMSVIHEFQAHGLFMSCFTMPAYSDYILLLARGLVHLCLYFPKNRLKVSSEPALQPNVIVSSAAINARCNWSCMRYSEYPSVIRGIFFKRPFASKEHLVSINYNYQKKVSNSIPALQ